MDQEKQNWQPCPDNKHSCSFQVSHQQYVTMRSCSFGSDEEQVLWPLMLMTEEQQDCALIDHVLYSNGYSGLKVAQYNNMVND